MRSPAVRWAKVAISLVVWMADEAAGRLRPGWGRAYRHPGVALMYHDVPPDERRRFAAHCDLLLALGAPTALADLDRAPDGRWRIAVTFDDGFPSFVRDALPEMAERRIPSTLFVPSAHARLGGTSHADGSRLSVDQLRALPDDVEVGSHSRTHPFLPELDDTELAAELRISRTELIDALGGTVDALAFPFGVHDDRVDEAARHAGYRRCYGIVPRPARRGDYVTGRVQIDPTDHPLEARLKMLGAYRWMAIWMARHRLRDRMRRPSRYAGRSDSAPRSRA